MIELLKRKQMPTVQVKLYSGQVVTAIVVKENPKTLWVQLPDGHTIKRHKQKHIVKENEQRQTTED